MRPAKPPYGLRGTPHTLAHSAQKEGASKLIAWMHPLHYTGELRCYRVSIPNRQYGKHHQQQDSS